MNDPTHHDAEIYEFPPVTQDQAIAIVHRYLAPKKVDGPLKCYAQAPDRCSVWLKTDEPCWWIPVPWLDGVLTLRSSRIILVGRQTGNIHYDGSAHDEG